MDLWASCCVDFIALTAVLQHELDYTPFCAKDTQSTDNYGSQMQAMPPS